MMMNNLIVVHHRAPNDYFREKKDRFSICLCMHVLRIIAYDISGSKSNNLE